MDHATGSDKIVESAGLPNMRMIILLPKPIWRMPHIGVLQPYGAQGVVVLKLEIVSRKAKSIVIEPFQLHRAPDMALLGRVQTDVKFVQQFIMLTGNIAKSFGQVSFYVWYQYQ